MIAILLQSYKRDLYHQNDDSQASWPIVAVPETDVHQTIQMSGYKSKLPESPTSSDQKGDDVSKQPRGQ